LRVSPHWGLSLAGAISCVLLSSIVIVYVLSAFYYHVDVIAKLDIDIGLIRKLK